MALPKPIISIVTPTYNREDELIHLIESIQIQSLSPEYFEMIISDDGSTDGTAEKVKELQFVRELENPESDTYKEYERYLKLHT